jgi:dolichyl-diphosphooligosaccharide--protein glycosyltransferase
VLFVLATLALLARSLDFPTVSGSDAEIVLQGADGWFHARRALYTTENFPSVLAYDTYLNHPHGAAVPWPPLYDWLLGASAVALGGSVEALEQVLVWASPVLGAASVPVVFAAGRAAAGTGVGLVAAGLFAVLPISASSAGIGNPDHHAFLALMTAGYLALSLVWMRRGEAGGSLAGIGAGLVAVRVSVILSWSGSPLYLVIGEGALLFATISRNGCHLLKGQAIGAASTAAAIVPVVALGPEPLGGWFSALALSWLQVVLLLAVAWTAGSLAWVEGRSPGASFPVRLTRAALLALLPAFLIVLPQLREGIAPALEYLGRTGSFSRNAEQIALYMPWRVGPERNAYPALLLYGGFAYLIPALLLPILLRARDFRERGPMIVLLIWTLSLGLLAVSQLRWGNDFAPAAAIGFALTLATLQRGLARGGSTLARLALPCAVAAGLALLSPTWSLFYGPRIESVLDYLRGTRSAEQLAVSSPEVTFARFARRVGQATPPTRGYLDATERPEYGMLSPPGVGHALRYIARRPVPADNFGPQLDAGTYESVRRFYGTASEDEAVAIAERLGARYVVVDSQLAGRERVARRLYARGGSWSPYWKPLSRFRLLTEGPAGVPRFGRGHVAIPYKLFEVVAGAVLEARAMPGSPLQATLSLRTPARNDVRFRARALADASGHVRVRVPYSTGVQGEVQALGLYAVELEGSVFHVPVTEMQVQTGAVITVEDDSCTASGPPC